MNEPNPLPDEPIEELVRAHLLRAAQSVDAAGILAGIQARVAARQPAHHASTPERVAVPLRLPARSLQRWGGRLALATAAAVLLAVLVALPLATPQASAETLVREAQKAHARPVDRCYLRTESNFEAAEGDFLPPLPEAKLWTRGEQFFMETYFPDRTGAWGRDAQGRVWFAPLRWAGFRFEPHEVREQLARLCDLRSMNVDKLLTDVLGHFDLRRQEPAAPGGLLIVEAEPKADRPGLPLRFVRLEIDPGKKILHRIETRRRLPHGLTTVSFTLVPNTPPQPDASYTLEGHLDPEARIFSMEQPPPLRMKMLRWHYEMGRR